LSLRLDHNTTPAAFVNIFPQRIRSDSVERANLNEGKFWLGFEHVSADNIIELNNPQAGRIKKLARAVACSLHTIAKRGQRGFKQVFHPLPGPFHNPVNSRRNLENWREINLIFQ
jgi:uncharacterized protein YaeQ